MTAQAQAQVNTHTYPYPLSVAPMLHWTDKHCRYFHRLLSKTALLYTDMITTPAILYGDKKRLLDFNQDEHPVSLQLGGAEAASMSECAKIGQDWGYDEININVGCPSERVKQGEFGACLMKTPHIVAQCVEAMRQKTTIPITVKCRIGVDELDGYEHLVEFVSQLANAGAQTLIIHARKAWLAGLSPKENRTIPELKYDFVHHIKRDFPTLNIVINGGIQTAKVALDQCDKVDGVMLGRAAYHNPYLLTEIEHGMTDNSNDTHDVPHCIVAPSREQVLDEFLSYMKVEAKKGVRIRAMTRHILGLYYAQPGARDFRRLLSGKVVSLEDIEVWLKGR